MWAIISMVFLGLYALMSFYLGHRGWSVFKSLDNRFYKGMYWAFFGILILSFPLARFGGGYLSGTSERWLTLWSWYAMLAVVYIFMLLLLIDFLRIIDKRLQFIPAKIRGHQRTPLFLGTTVIALVTLVLIYGSWNAKNPIVTHYEITVDKHVPALNQLKIAMVSDIHYGEIIDAVRLKPMVEKINELKPDIILMAGDIIEGTVNKEEGNQLLQLLNQMTATYGIIAVPGNHDRWARSESELMRTFKDSGIKVLKDEQFVVENAFTIIGRDDPGWGSQNRKNIKDLIEGVNPSLPIIVLDHQPIDLDNVQALNADLQVSGHTHMGQIFPSNFITGRIYELDWGLLKKDNYNLIVSSGFGTWGPPLRIGTKPEIVFITMNFLK